MKEGKYNPYDDQFVLAGETRKLGENNVKLCDQIINNFARSYFSFPIMLQSLQLFQLSAFWDVNVDLLPLENLSNNDLSNPKKIS